MVETEHVVVTVPDFKTKEANKDVPRRLAPPSARQKGKKESCVFSYLLLLNSVVMMMTNQGLSIWCLPRVSQKRSG